MKYEIEDFITLAARRKKSLPQDYSVSRWQRIDEDGYLVEISKTRILTKGARKGRLTWRDTKGKRLSEVVETLITFDDIKREKDIFEKETGRCRECFGNGMRIVGWSVIDGNRTEKCKYCEGTGNSKKQ